MFAPPEAHYPKIRNKLLPLNDFDEVSTIIFIFWGINLYFGPNKYLECAIHIWRSIHALIYIYHFSIILVIKYGQNLFHFDK